MVLKIGDSGITVEYINAFFDIDSKIYTDETARAVQKFQQSYLQRFSHIPNIYTDNEILDSYTQLINGEGSLYEVSLGDFIPPLYPTGEVDIFTMTAMLGIDIDYNDYTKIKQVQQCLSGTEYAKFENVFQTLVEMAQNIEFRLDDNTDYIPTLIDGEIKRILEDLNDIDIESDHVFEQDNLADYEFKDVTIFGKSSVSSKPYRHKSGQYLSIEDKSGNNIPLRYCSIFSDLSTLVNQSPSSPKYISGVTSIDLLQLPENLLNASKFETLASYTNEYETRMTNLTYTLGSGNFNVITGTSDEIIKFPVVSDIIPPEDRNLYMGVIENTPLYIYRNQNMGEGYKEYLILLDRSWQVLAISQLSSVNGLLEVSIPLGVTRVGYLYKPDANTNGKVTNLGIYQTAELINITLNNPLFNCFNYLDEYEITSGRLITRNAKFTFTSDTEVSLETLGDKVYLTTVIQNIQPSSSPLFLCSHYGSTELVQDGTKIYLYDSTKTTLSAWKTFIQNQVGQSTPITIWYVTNNEVYTNQVLHNISLGNFKYLKVSDYQMEVKYQRHSNAASEPSDITNSNPYFPSTITGSGQDGSITIATENFDSSLSDIKILEVEEPLYGLEEGFGDYYNITSGTISKRSHRLILTGNEHTIDLSPHASNKYIVFGIPGVFSGRRLTYGGVCNYFTQIDDVWLGQEQGFAFSSAGAENLYISIDIKILRIGRNSTAIEKISAFRSWLRGRNSAGIPVEVYWISNTSPEITQVTPVSLQQYPKYTRIYNDANSQMRVRLNVVTGLIQGEVLIKGLQDEGNVDLVDKVSEIIDITGFYNKQTIEILRRYQHVHDIGQDTPFGRYYSGILNIPTYNSLKKEFGLIEEVE